jgi:hypothetical protein
MRRQLEGTQCTIVWYVDDNKISHVNPAVVTHVIEKIEERFGNMNVTRGKEHNFLGMNFIFHENETVSVSMKLYLEEAIRDSALTINRQTASPASKGLFEVEETSPPLPKTDSEIFHSVVAKLLYVALRARPDILLAVSFLCTRVAAPTVHDQKKDNSFLSTCSVH